jgi:hypothetical protein
MAGIVALDALGVLAPCEEEVPEETNSMESHLCVARWLAEKWQVDFVAWFAHQL